MRITALEDSGCGSDDDCGTNQCAGDCQNYDWQCPSEDDIDPDNPDGCIEES